MDVVYRQDVIDHFRKRLIETANNNVGYQCDAGSVFQDAAERIRVWANEVPPAQPNTSNKPNTLQSVECVDTISRQAAIDSALNDDIVVMVANDDDDKDFAILEKTRKGIARNLEVLPSADAQPVRHGKWTNQKVAVAHIYEWQMAKCSACGLWTTSPYQYCFRPDSYCPWCGAKMEGSEDETD